MLPNPADLLRTHLRSHNLSVLAASAAALLMATVGWTFLYGMSYWIAMLVETVRTHGEGGVSENFRTGYGIAVGSTMLLAVLDVLIFPHEEARDGRNLLGHAIDLVLFLPRITLAALQNFSAWAWLPGSAKKHAARLLVRLRAEDRVPMYELPLEIPNDAVRDRVVAVLETTQLAEVRTEKGQLVLRWSALAPAEFRSLPHHAHHDPPAMRRATVLEDKDALPGPQSQPALRNGDDL